MKQKNYKIQMFPFKVHHFSQSIAQAIQFTKQLCMLRQEKQCNLFSVGPLKVSVLAAELDGSHSCKALKPHLDSCKTLKQQCAEKRR